ncbi:MAG: hypothetical protein GY943_07255, partial [Chloroflexi bacterium]|nr:hypothetical protein [Chloroflexota bacterium]
MDEQENGRVAADFWTAVTQSTDKTAYKPARNDKVVASRLQTREGETYFVLKQPETKSYLRLSESDYAVWWQMDGQRSIKQLLFYCLKRYRTLPIGHLNGLLQDFRNGRFLSDTPVNLYNQLDEALVQREPASRGRQIINRFLHTEITIDGLDDFFSPLYARTKWLFSLWGQLFLLALIILGGVLFSVIFFAQNSAYRLTGQGGWSVASLFIANILVIGIHELGHGLATKHYGRELDRGGFLIYWGMPAFFVDTRDIWMSPRQSRVAVSWAGPHSGFLVGGVVGVVLTAVSLYAPDQVATFWTTFLFQVGFIAYFSVFINLNPLLELDGYFILMDWLDMPGLRARAFRFWRKSLWDKIKTGKTPPQIWESLNQPERIFTLYGALAFIYSAYALWFAFYFWQERLAKFLGDLWSSPSIWGRLAVLAITAVIIIPTAYFLGQLGLSRIRLGLDWLARRNLLARPDVLALLIGVPLLGGLLTLLLFGGGAEQLLIGVVTWLIHISAILVMIGIARQLPGSRFQWAIWALVAAPVGLTIAWVGRDVRIWHEFGLIVTAVSILAAGIVSWHTVGPKWLEKADLRLMALMILVGPLYYLGLGVIVGDEVLLGNGRWLVTILILAALSFGLIFMSPLLINFRRSRFVLPWGLFILAMLAVPWLQFRPFLHLPVAVLWLYAGLLYLLVGALAQFARIEYDAIDVNAYDERARLVDGFNYFLRAFFTSYEAIFGNRRLEVIQGQMAALGTIDKDATVLQIAERAQQALLLAVDRLDDLAGTPFTQQAGQAAYDSLPWLHAETLARHVLSNIQWGSQLAQGFINARDRRAELIRRADIFAGFDQDAVEATLAVVRGWSGRDNIPITRAGNDAKTFYLIEFGEVGIFHDGVQVGKLTPGGYFGTNALLDSGSYQFT